MNRKKETKGYGRVSALSKKKRNDKKSPKSEMRKLRQKIIKGEYE